MAVTGVNTGLQATGLQQIHQYRHQYGKQNGMGAIMHSLTPDQRQQISSVLKSLSEDQRQQVKEQILQLDAASMTQDQLFDSIMAILNSVETTSETTVEQTSTVSLYA